MNFKDWSLALFTYKRNQLYSKKLSKGEMQTSDTFLQFFCGSIFAGLLFTYKHKHI